MTEKERADYHNMVAENIKKFGYHATFVFSDNLPSFCYSTGIFKSFQIPELFISSLPENLSLDLTSKYVDRFKETTTIPLNKKIEDLSDRFAVFLVAASIDKLKDYVLSSVKFYKSDKYKYLQLIYPDINGYFPNEAGYDYDQEIIGEFKC